MAAPQSTAYGWLMLTGIAVTLVFWSRLAKRNDRLMIVYIEGLAGAFFGAKIVYLAAEGWLFWKAPDRWLIWATGKSIVGALLGGYAAVEIAKKQIGYKEATGDWFAMIVPLGVMIGRIGCLMHGCCQGKVCQSAWYAMHDAAGVPRWPAVPVEMLFNALMILLFFVLRRTHRLAGQHFHLYLIGYGLFRFAHESVRDTPQIAGIFSGYQIASIAVVALGIAGFVRRARLEWLP